MGEISFTSMAVKYTKVSPDLTLDLMNGYALGKFSEHRIIQGAAYYAIVTDTFKGTNYDELVGIILSTDENECCYDAGNPSVFASMSVTLESSTYPL